MSHPINIHGGAGILVNYMASQYLIELDTSILSSSPYIPLGIIDESTMLQLTYVDSHAMQTDDQTWTIENDNNTGMQMTVQTATVYDAEGDNILYSMIRDLTFNSLGQLVSVSAERRITIDTTESCS